MGGAWAAIILGGGGTPTSPIADALGCTVAMQAYTHGSTAKQAYTHGSAAMEDYEHGTAAFQEGCDFKH